MEDHSSKDSKCPSCGGRLLFAPEKQLLCCDFCGNEYSPEKIELLLQIPEIDAGEAGEKEEDKCELVCDSCGAVLIAEEATSAITCSFCLEKKFRKGRPEAAQPPTKAFFSRSSVSAPSRAA